MTKLTHDKKANQVLVFFRSRIALKRVREYRARHRSSATSDFDYLCAAATTAHSGLRLYLLVTTPSPPTPAPPTPALVPLIGSRSRWLDR